MRFVSTETVRIDLSDDSWIDVKRELSSGEERAYRTAGFKKVSQNEDTKDNEVSVDWSAMAFARVEAYLVDWNAKAPNGKDLPVSPRAIRNLSSESFEEIDQAIQAHIEAMDAAKKTRPGDTTSTASPS